jgi:hypothetical protein
VITLFSGATAAKQQLALAHSLTHSLTHSAVLIRKPYSICALCTVLLSHLLLTPTHSLRHCAATLSLHSLTHSLEMQEDSPLFSHLFSCPLTQHASSSSSSSGMVGVEELDYRAERRSLRQVLECRGRGGGAGVSGCSCRWSSAHCSVPHFLDAFSNCKILHFTGELSHSFTHSPTHSFTDSLTH